MMIRLVWATIAAAALAQSGCGKSPASESPSADSGESPPAAPAAATHAPRPTSGPNAAEKYRVAFTQFNSGLKLAAASVKWEPSGPVTDPGTGYTWDMVAGILKKNQPLIEDLISATKIERCDFGLTPIKDEATQKQDLERTLPILEGMRNTARILCADAARLWAAGDHDAAVERIVSVYRFGRQVSYEPVRLASLTNIAILSLANSHVRTMASAPGPQGLTPSQAAALRAAIGALDETDPSGDQRALAAGGPGSATGLDGASSAKFASDMAETKKMLESKK